MSTTDPNTPVPDSSTNPQPAPSDSPDSITVNRAEYDLMQEHLAQARATFEALNPHAQRLEKLVKDPHAGELFDNAVRAYEQFEQNRGPKVREDVQPLYDKVAKIEKYVDDYEATRKAELERPQREYQAHYNEWQNS